MRLDIDGTERPHEWASDRRVELPEAVFNSFKIKGK